MRGEFMNECVQALGVDVHVENQMLLIPTKVQLEEWVIVPALGLSTRVKFVNKTPASWSLTDDGLIVQIPFHDFDRSDVVYAASMFAAERVRQQNGHFLIHGSCVANQRGAVLLIGEGGCGKTSVALALALTKNLLFISGDETPLCLLDGKLFAFGHHERIRVRARSLVDLADTIPELGACIAPELLYWANSKYSTGWDEKQLVSPESIGLNTTKKAVPIKLIVDLRVLFNTELHYSTITPPWKVRTWFYSHIPRRIHGVYHVIDNSGKVRARPFITDEENVWEPLLSATSQSGYIPTIRLRGTLKDVTSILCTWLEDMF
jgi:hypothetical protein